MILKKKFLDCNCNTIYNIAGNFYIILIYTENKLNDYCDIFAEIYQTSFLKSVVYDM